ncbi:MAG: YhbY family RNA-binding protein [Clostridium sp.]
MKRSGNRGALRKAAKREMKRSGNRGALRKAAKREMKRSGIERCVAESSEARWRVAMRSEKEENDKQTKSLFKKPGMKMEPIMQIGKATITPELTESVEQALEARELIKINVLKTVWQCR